MLYVNQSPMLISFFVASRRHLYRPTTPPAERERLPITVSIGVADTTTISGPPQAIIEEADAALYKAKKRGRNRVSLAG